MSPPFPVVAATCSVESKCRAGASSGRHAEWTERREGMEDRGVHGDNESNTLLQVEGQYHRPQHQATGSMLSFPDFPDIDYAGLDWGSGRGLGWCEGGQAAA